ncbi:MAG: hypothetical protein GY950_13240 [bacterium]|nr:hypothetical protein [bacterium]
MADRADVNVKNVLADDINVIRKLPDGSSDINAVIANGNEEQIHLPGPEVSLQINAPVGMDTNTCPLKVISDVDLAVSHSRTSALWTMRIESNELPPETPTTVNVTVGEIGPG